MTGIRTFRLLRYFLAVIVLAIPTVTGAAAWLTSESFRAEFFDEAKSYATEVAENVYNHVERNFLRPLREEGKYVDLLGDPEQLRRIEEVVALSTHRHRVDKLYFFEPDGTISFSTVREHIGEAMPPGNIHFAMALNGQVASVVRGRSTPLDISETPPGKELLETYVPVYSTGADGRRRLSGVVEVYQDMTKLLRGVSHVRRRIALAALASMGVLGGLFALITLKADRVIQERERQILSSNAALQGLSRSLERQVEERTRQLIQKEKLASLGTLAAGVAHEINNPLATVAACAEGSLDRFRGGALSPEALKEVQAYLELIGDEVYRVKRITRNLLDFSRQRTSATHDPIDLDALAMQTVELVKLGEEAKGVTLDLDLSAGKSEGLRGDPTQVRQVIHNLLSNALAAVRGGEGPRVLLRTRAHRDRFVLDCIDSGPGIPPEMREKVFEPFFTTKPAGEGTGLGLTVCYSIAQRHGGSLEVVPPETPLESPSWQGRVGGWLRLTLPAEGGGPRGDLLELEEGGKQA